MAIRLTHAAFKRAQGMRRDLLLGKGGAYQLRSKNLRELYDWCMAHGLTEPVRSDGIWQVTYNDLRTIEKALSTLGLPSLHQEIPYDRYERINQGFPEHKATASQPTENRVLCLLSTTLASAQIEQTSVYACVDVDWNSLKPEAFAGIIVVENADVFYRLTSSHHYLVTEFNQYLWLYRGHEERTSKGLRKLQKAWQHLPQIYFGDGDPQGFRIAYDGGFDSLLLPSVDVFLQEASATDYSASQQPNLQPLTQLSPYRVAFEAGKAILQQRLLDLPLAIVPIR